MLVGSIEAGGTKFVCAVGNENLEVIDQTVFKTADPVTTLELATNYFQQFNDLQAMSVASFGPIEIRPDHPKYGYVTDTPKLNWANFDFLGFLQQQFDFPIYWTTDVNGSAYGEYIIASRHHQPLKALVYYTIGTGVGAGIVYNGHFIGDQGHPEVGHVRLKRHPDDLAFKGICPYHGDCLEGLVAGPTFEARTGKPGPMVPLTDHVWEIMAYYVAQAAIQATLFIRPQKIVFGGGVISEPFLRQVRTAFSELMNNYQEVGSLESYLVMPTIPENGSATVGNFALALKKLLR